MLGEPTVTLCVERMCGCCLVECYALCCSH